MEIVNTPNTILCPSCGIPIQPNPTNLCINCIRADIDITEGIPKQSTIHFCRGCDRYLQPPNIWVQCELESRELLALCIKKLKGLGKVRLVDASFIWTEPHSKRIKIKLTIQKEVYAGAILQQVFMVEFVVCSQYCEDCTRVDAQLTWKAVVQLRQKVPHKRTFLWMEQLILKHNAHKDTSNIKEFRDGLDFYYSNRSHAIRMADFLTNIAPCKVKTSEQLVSSDVHTGTADIKYTFSIEIAPICKDDLLCLTNRMAASLSNISPLSLCIRVSNSLTVLDPQTGVYSELRGNQFWEAPFQSLSSLTEMIEFYVIDIQIESFTNGKYQMAIAEVARSNNFSQTYLVRTHLGRILHPGDHCKGYLLVNTNYNHDEFEKLSLKGQLPEVILVRKSYPNYRKKQRQRNWKLKRMAVVEEEVKDKTQDELDYDIFLKDVEEDPEMRGMIQLFKAKPGEAYQPAVGMEEDDEEPEQDFPEIKLDELLDDMENMHLDE